MYATAQQRCSINLRQSSSRVTCPRKASPDKTTNVDQSANFPGVLSPDFLTCQISRYQPSTLYQGGVGSPPRHSPCPRTKRESRLGSPPPRPVSSSSMDLRWMMNGCSSVVWAAGSLSPPGRGESLFALCGGDRKPRGRGEVSVSVFVMAAVAKAGKQTTNAGISLLQTFGIDSFIIYFMSRTLGAGFFGLAEVAGTNTLHT